MKRLISDQERILLHYLGEIGRKSAMGLLAGSPLFDFAINPWWGMKNTINRIKAGK